VRQAPTGTFVVKLTVGDGTSTDSLQQSVSCSIRGKRLHCN